MSFAETMLIILGTMLILLFSGMRVAFALGMTGLIGLLFLIPGIRMPERMMGNLAWGGDQSISPHPGPAVYPHGGISCFEQGKRRPLQRLFNLVGQ